VKLVYKQGSLFVFPGITQNFILNYLNKFYLVKGLFLNKPETKKKNILFAIIILILTMLQASAMVKHALVLIYTKILIFTG
jgi:hypothetical protein